MKRLNRVIIEYLLRGPDPSVQPPLDLDPPQPAQGDLTIEERFAQFHSANPHVYAALRSLALAEAERGARRISPKLLFEQLRSHGCATVTAPTEEYRLNNIYTSRYARLLASEPGLMGMIPTRSLKAE